MELEDLKTAWKSIDNELGHISKNDTESVLTNHKRDVKASIINRFYREIVALVVATIFIGTSGLWAFVKMPVWWIGAFCILFVAGAVILSLLIKRISKINLGEYTQRQIMEQILTIKKIYRNIELYGCAIILALTVCGVLCSPIAYTTGEIVFVSVVTIICYFLEYLSYRSNIKKINKMQNWLD